MSSSEVIGQEQAEVHVIEDSEEEQERKRELEERLAEQGDAESDVGDVALEGVSKGSAKTMIAEARKHIGYQESGENDTKFNRWLGSIKGYPHGGYGYPWCHSFLSYCLAHSGNAGAGPRTAGCATGVSWFRSNGRFRAKPRVGDFVYYGAGGGTHVEVVAAVTPTTIRTIGGNTSGSLGGNYFNGDGVYEKVISRSSSKIYGFGSPAYASTAVPSGNGGGSATVTPVTSMRTVKQQQEAVNALGYTPKLAVDNEWGPKTAAGVKWLQKKVGTGVDGQWGKDTEAKYLAYKKK